MVQSRIDSPHSLLRRSIDRAAPLRTQSPTDRQSFDFQNLKFATFLYTVQWKWQYHHWNERNRANRIRLVSAFYHNFQFSNSRIKRDIENLFSLNHSKYCKNTVGFFREALSILNLEIAHDSVFCSKSHVWREMREIGKSSVGVYQVTEFFDTIFEKI